MSDCSASIGVPMGWSAPKAGQFESESVASFGQPDASVASAAPEMAEE